MLFINYEPTRPVPLLDKGNFGTESSTQRIHGIFSAIPVFRDLEIVQTDENPYAANIITTYNTPLAQLRSVPRSTRPSDLRLTRYTVGYPVTVGSFLLENGSLSFGVNVGLVGWGLPGIQRYKHLTGYPIMHVITEVLIGIMGDPSGSILIQYGNLQHCLYQIGAEMETIKATKMPDGQGIEFVSLSSSRKTTFGSK